MKILEMYIEKEIFLSILGEAGKGIIHSLELRAGWLIRRLPGMNA